jgi:hypothetical protein
MPDPRNSTHPAPEPAELARAFARALSSADGELVLAHLRRLTRERSLGPDVPDATLRHLEGQRQLVAQIEALVARGRAGT